PAGKIYAKQYTVIRDVQHIRYHRGLRKQAFQRHLHALGMNLESGGVEVVVGDTEPEMVDDFKQALWEDEERSHVLEVQESDYDAPIKVGFEVKTDLKIQLEELKRYKQELEQTEFELRKAEVRRMKLQKSFSWKASKPIRVIGALFKNSNEHEKRML